MARAELTIGAGAASEVPVWARAGLLVTGTRLAVCTALVERAERVVGNKRQVIHRKHALCRAAKPDLISIDLSFAEPFAALGGPSRRSQYSRHRGPPSVPQKCTYLRCQLSASGSQR